MRKKGGKNKVIFILVHGTSCGNWVWKMIATRQADAMVHGEVIQPPPPSIFGGSGPEMELHRQKI
jgi:hypothetical protein